MYLSYQKNMSFKELDNDVIIVIFRYLNVSSMFKLSQVCTLTNNLLKYIKLPCVLINHLLFINYDSNSIKCVEHIINSIKIKEDTIFNKLYLTFAQLNEFHLNIKNNYVTSNTRIFENTKYGNIIMNNDITRNNRILVNLYISKEYNMNNLSFSYTKENIQIFRIDTDQYPCHLCDICNVKTANIVKRIECDELMPLCIRQSNFSCLVKFLFG